MQWHDESLNDGECEKDSPGAGDYVARRREKERKREGSVVE
jgi:hypothetical protein